MGTGDPLTLRRSSASLPGEATALREQPVLAKYIDTTTCIGCKACEVACQEWNDLPSVATRPLGTYQTLPALDASFWNLIKFREQERDGALSWLMRKDQCMHCADPGCLKACPAPGAIVQYENGIVDVNADACIGCGLCAAGCPFDVPKFHEATGKMAKCTLCVDRVTVGLEPACIKACPTGCLRFGTKEEMVALGEARVAELTAGGFPEAKLYDPPGVGGTGVVTVLAHGDHPEWYELPANPTIPWSIRLTRSILRPIGLVALFGAVATMFGHFLRYGPSAPAGPALPAPTPHGQAENTVTGEHIVRHGLASRAIHWSVALGFFVALLTGLPIWTPIFGWTAALFGGLDVCRWLHPWAGMVFVAAALAMFVKWVGEMGRRAEGKYNRGQKLFFFLVALLALSLLATGLLLWFPLSIPLPLRGLGLLAHDALFLVFAVAIVVHIYLGTAAYPGTFRSMTRGTVSKAWARLHHPRWAREVSGDKPDDPA